MTRNGLERIRLRANITFYPRNCLDKLTKTVKTPIQEAGLCVEI
jgi:hypothetical protein